MFDLRQEVKSRMVLCRSTGFHLSIAQEIGHWETGGHMVGMPSECLVLYNRIFEVRLCFTGEGLVRTFPSISCSIYNLRYRRS